MSLKNKTLECKVLEFKVKKDSRKFTCYANTKGNVDHALDKTMNGAYMASIKRHKTAGTMPKMFWSHNSYDPPVGAWLDMEEDSKGLLMEGEFANTPRGLEMLELYKSGALDSFSIGYSVTMEKWNHEEGYNELHEIDIKETSCVAFACNEESLLVGLKAKLDAKDIPTKRELEKFLHEVGLSRKQSELIASRYDDKTKSENVFDLIVGLGDLDLQA